MVHNFPVRECLIEGHFRIPIVHWFHNFKYREKLTLVFVKVGFGIHRGNLNNIEYVKKVWKFIDEKCHYRTETEIENKFSNLFLIKRIDKEKLLYHLKKRNGFGNNLRFIVQLLPQKLINKIEKRRGSITLFARKIS